MADIDLKWAGDLGVNSLGDLLVADESSSTQQRLCRRLLTNAGDYVWNLDYGGGLPQFVGSTASIMSIEAVIRAQIQLETSIPPNPPPQISTTVNDVGRGVITTTIIYTDPSTQMPNALNLNLN